MGRPTRRDEAGLVHHVTAHAVHGDVLFRDDEDRHAFLGRLMATRHRWRLTVLAWCLMTNHVHLVVRQERPTLSRSMHDLLGGFARAVNDRHERQGHLFDRRYAAKTITDDAQIAACFAYLARNPVEAFIVRSPVDYPWSGHGALAGLVPPLPFHDVAAALAYLHTPTAQAHAAYLRLVEST